MRSSLALENAEYDIDLQVSMELTKSKKNKSSNIET
jgi:hypothetical protein